MPEPLRVALVHYHLRGGGVARVLGHQLAALRDGEAGGCVLVGEEPEERQLAALRPEPEWDGLRVVGGLSYDTTRASHDPETVLAEMRDAARQALGGPPDLWHIHNHSLGKNAVLPLVVEALAEAGERLLLQPHDFAEDGRPDRYAFLTEALGGGDAPALAGRLYPAGPHVHYATLNRRDRGFLAAAGQPETRLHALPNAVDLGDLDADAPPAEAPGRRYFLYPTRAIRRKNLGEMLLWAAAADRETRFGVTLAPKNPQQRPVYERWVAFAAELGLPVTFEAGGADVDFAALLRSATALVSTSVGEGFGLAFLEPWLVGRPLAGRALPEITDEFVAAGVDLDGLYTRLGVPLEWVDRSAFVAAVRDGLRAALAAYGRTLQSHDLDRAVAASLRGERVDMGRLNEPLQEQVIQRVAQDPAAREALVPPRLHDPAAAAAVAANRARIAEIYSLERYGERLRGAYDALGAEEPGPLEHLDGGTLLECFLDPARFCLLRS